MSEQKATLQDARKHYDEVRADTKVWGRAVDKEAVADYIIGAADGVITELEADAKRLRGELSEAEATLADLARGLWYIAFPEDPHDPAGYAAQVLDEAEREHGYKFNDGKTVRVDPEARASEQEREHYEHLDELDNEREVQAFFDEHGLEPGGICPNCGHTDAGCTCDK